jgi:hypothetical protein
MKKSIVAIILFMLFSALIWALLITRESQPNLATQGDGRSAETERAKLAAAADSMPQKRPSLQQPTNSPTVVLLYEQSTDYSAFYRQFKASPDPVERFMAYKVFSECAALFSTVPAATAKNVDNAVKLLLKNIPHSAKNREGRIAAIRAAWQRCSGFDMDAELIKEANKIAMEQISRGELPLGAGQLLANASNKSKIDPETVGNFIESAKTLSNGYALFEALAPLTSYAHAGMLSIDGNKLDGSDAKAAASAITLLACEWSQVCGSQSRMSQLYCITEGECGGDYPFAIQQFELTPAQLDRTNELKEQIASAIRQRNRSHIVLSPPTAR